MKAEDFISIELIPEENTTNKKTKIYGVFNKRSRYLLGRVRWFPNWRQYCLYPTTGVIFNPDCLRHIADFTETKTREHREANRKKPGGIRV